LVGSRLPSARGRYFIELKDPTGWIKIDEHELAVFLAICGEPMGDYEPDLYMVARRQAANMLHRDEKRRRAAVAAAESGTLPERMDAEALDELRRRMEGADSAPAPIPGRKVITPGRRTPRARIRREKLDLINDVAPSSSPPPESAPASS
jgi:hypothetical protein